ncbi:hypothetical protein T484DRAFT_1612572, partial [Baffinella frigidus]
MSKGPGSNPGTTFRPATPWCGTCGGVRDIQKDIYCKAKREIYCKAKREIYCKAKRVDSCKANSRRAGDFPCGHALVWYLCEGRGEIDLLDFKKNERITRRSRIGAFEIKNAGSNPPRRVCGSEFRVQGSGFSVQGSGFRVQSSGFRVQGFGFRVQGAGFRVQGAGFKVQGFGFRVQGSGFRVQGL